jgi:hypothetical protein
MLLLVGLVSLIITHDPFVADASAETEFVVAGVEQDVRNRLEQIQVLRQYMPGVVAIEEQGQGLWVYKTERNMPLSAVVRTDFVLARSIGESIAFVTPTPQADNWMLVKFDTRPDGNNHTSVKMHVRVRLLREDASSIHIFAPLLGEAFISERMRDDLDGMLESFAGSIQQEFERLGERMVTEGRTE